MIRTLSFLLPLLLSIVAFEGVNGIEESESCNEAEEEASLLDVQLLQTSVQLTNQLKKVSVQADGTAKLGSEGPSAHVSALQTSQQVEVKPNGDAAAEASRRSEADVLKAAAPHKAVNSTNFLAEALPLPGTRPLLLQLSTLQEISGGGLAGADKALESLAGGLLETDAATLPATLVLCLYFLVYVFCVASMHSNVSGAQRQSSLKRLSEKSCAEEVTLNRSVLDWLCVSWLNPIVARLGGSWSSAMQQCTPDQIPQVGSHEMQAYLQGQAFEREWKAELAEKGPAAVSFLRVMMRLWGVTRLASFSAVLFIHIVLGNVYAVFLVQHSLAYFFWLQQHVWDTHGQYPDLAKPIMISIVAFSVLPLMHAVLCSIELHMMLRFDRQLAGAGVTLYKKTQRLPASNLGVAADPNGCEERVKKDVPNVMMLINNDLLSSFHGIQFSFACAINAVITILALVIMMAFRLRLATLFCLIVALPGLTLTSIMSSGVGISMMQLKSATDKRATAVREVLKGVRLVKCYAWEAAMEGHIGKLRSKEMVLLRTYFRLCGAFVCLFNVVPRLLTLVGLWAYTSMYGRHDLPTIFAILQILSSVRGQCESFSSNLRRIVEVQPSAVRLERYLLQAEAPVLPDAQMPSWADMWPEPQQDQAPGADAGGGALTHFNLQGSFSWTSGGAPVLHDLKLEVLRGELIAIVGGVGSGKSTLLQAALGELYPVVESEARLSKPRLCAYCPQVPHIAEGTLCDNIVFGESFEKARYQQAIAASSLEADRDQLTGGDDAFIGARGISLSGGQRSRVALARAAYHRNAELVLLDDPFGSVDAPTGNKLMENLVLGPLMKGRTRIVVLQPEIERLSKFDRIIVMSAGRVVASGKAAAVMETAAFKVLMRRSVEEEEGKQESSDSPDEVSIFPKRKRCVSDESATSATGEGTLRESEVEGRPTWEMVKHHFGVGKWRNLCNSLISFTLMLFLHLLCDISLANWTNALGWNPDVDSASYFRGYLFWLFCGTIAFLIGWHFGEAFSLNISDRLHTDVIKHLLHAPVDHFFDKHPLGRIMNRMTGDMSNIDLFLFMKISGSAMLLFSSIMPLIYVHAIMPFTFSALSMPFYYIIYELFTRYQNTTVPLRYCTSHANSLTNNLLSDAMANSVVVRGFGQEDRQVATFAASVDDAIKVSLTDERFLRRWFLNRVSFLWTFYNSLTFIVGMYSCHRLGAGTLGICITNLILLESMIDPNLEFMAGVLFELIALARVSEYREVPQELPMRVDEDESLRNFTLCVRRDGLTLTLTHKGGSVQVFKDSAKARHPLLQSSPDGRALILASKGVTWRDICPSCSALEEVGSLHRLEAANAVVGSAAKIAEVLCSGTSPKVFLDLRSNWLAGGAHLEVQDLKARYANLPRSVLKGISFTIDPRMRAAIIGTTGSGKSSMLLALLRLIEPRGGKVVINGVDTRSIGLATLRTALGLVPQDPMLFSGTVLHNLDPFGQYSPDRIWQALELTHLRDFVESLPYGLGYNIIDEGANLSFGQRQLLCLARMVLRQPALLLLDEATSAIDPKTQEMVQDTIESAFPASTLLAVAHRLETIMNYDYVVVLERGKVAEQGSVKEVAKIPNGVFRGMLDAREK